MRSVSRGVRLLSLSLGLVLVACGGSSKSSDAGDAAKPSDGSTGDTGDASGDGAVGQGAAGHDGGVAGGGGVAGFEGAAGDGGGDVSTEGGADGGNDVVATTEGGSETGSEGGASSDGGDTAASDAAPSGGLCGAFTLGAAVVTPTLVTSGGSIDAAGFLGGALASGTYYLTAVTHFGATYTGTKQEVLVIDAGAHTMEDAYASGTTTIFAGYTLTTPSTTVLAGAPSCGGAAVTATSWNYWVNGTGAGSTLSLNVVSSADVKVFTKQ